MMEFFRGWKRKVGVVTLVMACVLAAGWVRSRSIEEWLLLHLTKPTLLQVRSSDQGLMLFAECVSDGKSDCYKDVRTFEYVRNDRRDIGSHNYRIALYRGFGFDRKAYETQELEVIRMAFPYWSITIPLTLISFWLLLSKPVKSTLKKTPEPIAHGGGVARIMGGFFKPWRRKIGMVTLLMACLFTGGWVRSGSTRDLFNFPISETRLLILESNCGKVEWNLYENQAGIPACDFHYSLETRDNAFLFDGLQPKWQWSGYGFQAGVYEYLNTAGGRTEMTSHICKLPYWSIVTPMTLISLWLLLSKPRNSTPKKTAQGGAAS